MNQPVTPLKRKVFAISKTIGFEAAHYLPTPHDVDIYKNIHGHSFQLEAQLKGALNTDMNWLEDFAKLSEALDAVKAQLDHTLLNQIAGLENPTLEGLCVWISEFLSPRLPQLSQITVSRPSLGESCSLILTEG